MDLSRLQPAPRSGSPVNVQVRDDLLARERVGVQRYGTPLRPFNGRDALRDAYEEVLDLACYLRQLIVEREGEETPAPATPSA